MINAGRALLILIVVTLVFYIASIAMAQRTAEQRIEIPFRLVENVV
jgi:hypothetical protein